MSHCHIKTFSCVVLAALALTLVGCARDSYDKQCYVLGAARERAPVEARIDGMLEVRRLSVDAAFAGKCFVYRVDEHEYEPDYYHQFLVPPGIMLTNKTRQWLADSGLFARVLPADTRLEPTYTLEGSVAPLYGDFTEGSAPQAVLEIRYFLLKSDSDAEAVVFAGTYKATTPIPERTATAFVAALDRSLAEILTRLEADLENHQIAK